MKKYLKMTRNIVFFGGLYLIMTMLIGMIYSIFYSITNKVQSVQDIQNAIISKVYILNTIAAIITLGIFFLVLKNKEATLLKRCSFKKINRLDAGKIILVSISIAMFSCSVVYLTSSKFQSYSQVNTSLSSAYTSILAMMCVIVLIPIFEEILFRGLIFNELKKNMNIFVALIVQALIFAVFHGNMLQGLYTFVLGIILSLLYMGTGSLWASILSHIVYNLCGTIVFPLLLYYTSDFVYLYIGIGLIGTCTILFNMLKKHKNQ